MAKTKRRNKAYKPRDPESILLRFEPWKVAAVMNPLESIVDQLERDGTIDVADDGQAVFKDHCDGVWYYSPVAILGVVDAYEIHERRAGVQLQLDPLRRLANKLKYQMMIDQNDTAAARGCLERIRAATLNMTAGYAKRLIKDFQIMEAMEGVKA